MILTLVCLACTLQGDHGEFPINVTKFKPAIALGGGQKTWHYASTVVADELKHKGISASILKLRHGVIILTDSTKISATGDLVRADAKLRGYTILPIHKKFTIPQGAELVFVYGDPTK